MLWSRSLNFASSELWEKSQIVEISNENRIRKMDYTYLAPVDPLVMASPYAAEQCVAVVTSVAAEYDDFVMCLEVQESV